MDSQEVLLVDGLQETADVLRAVMEPRGITVNRIHHLDAPNRPVNQTPHVVVIDRTVQPDSPASCFAKVPRVVIQTEHDESTEPSATVLPHPFHYGDLIRLVEQLLDRAA